MGADGFDDNGRGLFAALIDARRTAGCLSPHALDEIAQRCGLTSNQAFGVASFFPQLYRVDTHGGRISGEPVDGGTCAPEAPAGMPVLGPEPRVLFPGAEEPGHQSSEGSRGDYPGLLKAPPLSPEAIRDELARADLTGRRRPGSSVARRLSALASSPGARRVVICDGGANDPTDGVTPALLARRPLAVVKGLLAAAHAGGAARAIVYVSGVPPSTVEGLRAAAADATAVSGGPGDASGAETISTEVEVVEGLPALVLAEETAIVAALEGRRPMPDPPWSPGQAPTLFGNPYLVLDPETLVNVAEIAQHGAEWYSGRVGGGRGTACYTVSGDVQRPALVEVPLGTTVRDIVEDVCGGAPEGHSVKAVQTGGVSGGWLPAAQLDVPAENEQPAAAGPTLEWGSLVVADDHACMIDLARSALGLLEQESCGRCVVCREGTMQMAEILTDIARGHGRRGDIDLLHMLGETLAATGPCLWGRAAANPVLTTIHHFRDEYEAHVGDKRCPAGVCSMAGSERER